jgi:hypothetical protein
MRRGFLLIGYVLVLSCGKKDTQEPIPPVPVPQAPAAAVLTFPLQNEECTAGVVVSSTQSTIPFSWNSAENAESYEVHVKNLENGISLSQSTMQTSLGLTLNRNTPYSWYIVSKSSKSATATTSATWKFYNSGPGKTTYAPFPAEIVSPAMGQKLSAVEKITLDWNGNDVDEDILNYDVYFGSSQSPALFKEKVLESILHEVNVNPNTTYYWKVITRDKEGNSSDSGVFMFSMN